MFTISLFSGAGGLDKGFEKAGFKLIWANEYDKNIYPTHSINFTATSLDTRDIRNIPSADIPACLGVIGGPPCQSWSEAGKLRGIEDERGKLFYEYIRVIKDKNPLFFLIENVEGILSKRHADAFTNILKLLSSNYQVSYKLVNAYDYFVPQDRKRVFIVGYRNDLGMCFKFPEKIDNKINLREAIWDLQYSAIPAKEGNKTNGKECKVPNHEYMTGGFSSMYMSRNRVRSWDEPSFTIQAGGRHAPIHPQAPKMVKLDRDKFEFIGDTSLYRRLSVRECARIQTFPDDFIFEYENVADGYKMVGNAVPVNLAYFMAKKIREDFENLDKK